MGIYKRSNSPYWLIRITSPSGRRIQRSAKTQDKKLAQQLHDKIKNELWAVDRLGKKQQRMWKEAAVRWVKERHYKRSLDKDIATIGWLDKHLAPLFLDDISRTKIEEIAEIKAKEGVKPRTVNNILQLIRSILRIARDEWEWLDKVPSVKLRKEPQGIVRWLTREEARRLIKELPPHLANAAIFSLATGLRAANVYKLKWCHIDFERKHAFVNWDQSKSKKPIPVPLNEDAMDVLHRIRAETNRILADKKYQFKVDEEHVFLYQGHPVKQLATRAWYFALDRAKIKNFRWHDLRHTWASWHVQNGTSLHELQQLGGWSCYNMVLRYAHLSSDQLTNAANRISGAKLVQHGDKGELDKL